MEAVHTGMASTKCQSTTIIMPLEVVLWHYMLLPSLLYDVSAEMISVAGVTRHGPPVNGAIDALQLLVVEEGDIGNVLGYFDSNNSIPHRLS